MKFLAALLVVSAVCVCANPIQWAPQPAKYGAVSYSNALPLMQQPLVQQLPLQYARMEGYPSQPMMTSKVAQTIYEQPIMTTNQPLIRTLNTVQSAPQVQKDRTVASPIYVAPSYNKHHVRQPIVRSHYVQQPIVNLQPVENIMVQRHYVEQPVYRQIVNQAVITPELFDKTTVNTRMIDQQVITPKIYHQTIVQPKLQEQYMTNKPILAQAIYSSAPAPGKSHLSSQYGLESQSGLSGYYGKEQFGLEQQSPLSGSYGQQQFGQQQFGQQYGQSQQSELFGQQQQHYEL